MQVEEGLHVAKNRNWLVQIEEFSARINPTVLVLQLNK